MFETFVQQIGQGVQAEQKYDMELSSWRGGRRPTQKCGFSSPATGRTEVATFLPNMTHSSIQYTFSGCSLGQSPHSKLSTQFCF